jgi:hypothetical protein
MAEKGGTERGTYEVVWHPGYELSESVRKT